MITLGIETSCDETAVAVVDKGQVLSDEVSSSVHLHAAYGGVVPEIASRFHTEYIFSVFKKALRDAKTGIKDIELIAVTCGPGLPGSLLVGKAFANALSFAEGLPLVEVDHVNAHIASCFISDQEEDMTDLFPFLGMVISGGHTNIYSCRSLNDFSVIARTKDDAAGEAFDKVAKILDLGYPGGPIIEKRAKGLTKHPEIRFPRALLNKKTDVDFSFSGIKTAVLYYWKDCRKTEEEKDKICSSFQEAIVDVIDKKVLRALELTGAERLAVGGGVVNNELLRQRLVLRCQRSGVKLYLPEKKYCTDNAAMVAFLGEKKFKAERVRA
ncbi:MAG: tRNA (adenosine(37)-N6)-threonylcarbamoyltransferase complex transferase subunit TsaD [Candidatus Omnitrophica bacterium]|nr:tRNA (adenosine(37)-N6)-threonylcarbamoyltransferase complex transferase subunit TsaD [Candidatus Omnitrophota bacterium]